ncbi:MAG: dTDP-glucose 4,6-dehydratase [Nanoarchaeota archaeon]|nr:dTDP-glucose 4,6-dehydratase [Nanoarchaeota archaeon]
MENEIKTKVIVTGGAGFIGSNFMHYMIDKYQNYDFIVIDKLTYAGNIKNLMPIMNRKNFRFEWVDISDKEKINQLVDENTIIINFAAESHVDNSITGPMIFTHTNVLGTHALLEIARHKKAKLFIQISTDEVYGSLNFDSPSSTENDILKPSSPYSASKAAAEMLCFSYIHTFKMPIIITRSSNNFGPYQYPEKVVPLFVTNLIEGKKVPLYGSGKNVRDWIYVEDNCEAIDFVMHKGKIGEVYNIGGGNEVQNVELTNKILNMMGVGSEMIEYVQDRLGHDLRYSLGSSKIMALGWMPRHSFEEALNKTIKWYKENEIWWMPLKYRGKTK